MRAYAIGDIHGQLDKLAAAHALIAEDRARVNYTTAPVVHVGDLVDRGPDSRGVVEFLISGLARGENWVVLKGNHDRMMALWLEETPRRDPCLRAGIEWLGERLGGFAALASWGVDVSQDETEMHAEARVRVPASQRAFLGALPTSFRHGELFFCHAGVRPGLALEGQTEDDLIWIRGPFHESPANHGALIVHGHTPVAEVTHYGNRLNLDTGAGYGRDLSAVVLEGRAVWLLTEYGRVAVTQR